MSRCTESRVRRVTEGPRLAGATVMPPGAAGTLQPSWHRHGEQLMLKRRHSALGLLKSGGSWEDWGHRLGMETLISHPQSSSLPHRPQCWQLEVKRASWEGSGTLCAVAGLGTGHLSRLCVGVSWK